MPLSTGSNASTNIVAPVGSQTKPSIFSRASSAIRLVFFNSSDLADPQKLYEVLSSLQSNLGLALRTLAGNQVLSGVRLTGLVFTAGQTRTISHMLGRPWRGWMVTSASGNVGLFVEAPASKGVTKTHGLTITSTNAGTYDFYVFGIALLIMVGHVARSYA